MHCGGHEAIDEQRTAGLVDLVLDRVGVHRPRAPAEQPNRGGIRGEPRAASRGQRTTSIKGETLVSSIRRVRNGKRTDLYRGREDSHLGPAGRGCVSECNCPRGRPKLRRRPASNQIDRRCTASSSAAGSASTDGGGERGDISRSGQRRRLPDDCEPAWQGTHLGVTLNRGLVRHAQVVKLNGIGVDLSQP